MTRNMKESHDGQEQGTRHKTHTLTLVNHYLILMCTPPLNS